MAASSCVGGDSGLRTEVDVLHRVSGDAFHRGLASFVQWNRIPYRIPNVCMFTAWPLLSYKTMFMSDILAVAAETEAGWEGAHLSSASCACFTLLFPAFDNMALIMGSCTALQRN